MSEILLKPIKVIAYLLYVAFLLGVTFVLISLAIQAGYALFS